MRSNHGNEGRVAEVACARLLIAALAVSLACADDSGEDDEVGPGSESGTGGGESDSGSETGTGEESGSGSESDSGSETDADTDTGTETEGEALVADAGESRYVLIDEVFELDASASTGAALYHWNFGDGTAQDEPSADPVASHSYAAPGRYYPVLTVYDGQGGTLATNVTITATRAPVHQPRQAGSVAVQPELDRVAVLDRDAGALTLIQREGDADAPSFTLIGRWSTCAGPRSLSADLEGGLIACPEVDAIQTFDWSEGPGELASLPRGSRPAAALRVGERNYVALAGSTGPEGAEGSGALAVQTGPALSDPFTVVEGFPDARGLAAWPDGRVAVSRWRSPDEEGQLRVYDPQSAGVELISLAYDPTPPSDTEIGGVPSYLDQLLVSPVGDRVAVPSTQANFAHGEYLSGEALTFETTVRAVVSFLVLGEADEQGLISASENFDLRKQFDNRGFAAAGVYSSRGDYLFVAMRGSRGVERYDALTGAQAGTLLDVGYAPSGLALSPDDRHLYVHAELSRELRVYDVGSFDVLPQPIATLATVDAEPLAEEVFRGKQLFNDSYDARLAKHGYIACAHCHLDGEADRRTWDFTDRGEGLRNTISLLGRAGLEHGPVHWSANFDEIQDFEQDIRGPFGGLGLLDDADWASGTVADSLGDPKVGLSEDLDALAAYVESLGAFPRSPQRTSEGSLSAEATAGKALFESAALGCVDCHSGAALSDSAWAGPLTPLLHDVGTLGPGSGLRLGEPLTGIDTPTLHALWNSPPYLHDGSAATLMEVLTVKNTGDLHGATSQLDETQLEQLVAYLLSLEGEP
ncbi:hypothetical protein G6O69_30295 [Pseudenhygromyxa sp. WMMC2535]|uniref:PKD domain-containing protein n=1 Tax=Pseudenhygromyxa sp. WMMC2535 TaxID=2712867 RepID=UPI001555932D|nr:PKD domain-containing protein [Pseudenhygromyxa sp. WMMC2535]NVB42152.1 hypothetical protein [Pseudenhygromyxa sp. WMMC2535]